MGSGGEWNFLLPYSEEMIICGVPTVPDPHNFSIPVSQNSLQGLFYIITHHFDLFVTLAFRRLSAFFGVTRTFYSTFHNFFLILYFYAIYAAIIFNLKMVFKKHAAEVWFSLVIILMMAVTVMLSCDEWSNRFIFSITPFLLIFALIGFGNRIQLKEETSKDDL